jgi:hypothetical protein
VGVGSLFRGAVEADIRFDDHLVVRADEKAHAAHPIDGRPHVERGIGAVCDDEGRHRGW